MIREHEIPDPNSQVSGSDMVDDLTFTHANLPDEDSDIRDFYKESTVFITGATGFLGKLCMEKLLRTCPDISKIYIIIRPKKGKEVSKRFDELFDEPSFDPLKRNFPDFRNKIEMVMGDVGLPGLGLSEEDKEKLIAEVDCIFHFAATVRFDEKIKLSTHINVRGVREILRLAKHMKKLRAFVQVSTAFSNCTHKVIDEKFYNPPITGEKLINLVDCLDDDMLAAITPTILGDHPNTYSFTKCVAEEVVKTEGKNLPIALYRPSIVIATVKEPVSGWIDNVYGATGVLLGVAMGLLRVLRCGKNNKADMVPADYVVNSCLAAAWDVASMKTLNNNKETQDQESREEKFDKEIPVYNFVCTPEQPITWDEFQYLSTKHATQIPTDKIVWRHMLLMVKNRLLYSVLVLLLHTIPAYLADFVIICLGKKPIERLPENQQILRRDSLLLFQRMGV
ncbi:unnamed protein product [Callosobruchus maculatus]|uniref:Fatty acyl-CoA reductase n=1 Tax=Callosobruchus maculatus TaxID=64391 RepID=A0A653DVU8_CALMS|nr:unnamed protein product [Callosobruchus maculatus]